MWLVWIKKTGEFLFYDCAAESPKGRRSLCYDRAAWTARKEHKPKDTAMDMAEAMGVEMLNEEEYRYLQSLSKFDAKSSSWIVTPAAIRKLGGAIYSILEIQSKYLDHAEENYHLSSLPHNQKLSTDH